jgi:DMSO/TMAO reductase YedYZ molybdopterin-dependent catalytic subunit
VGISLEELQLATRNHGMPLEALRWPVTPVGLHYLLVHYDIPGVDEADWRLEVGGRVTRPLSLSLAELRELGEEELAVTMECAGNGRAKLDPRPFSQPWLVEAVGTARWRGVPLAALLREAGPLGDAVEVVFTGLDGGLEGGVAQRYARSLPVGEALDGEALLAYAMNGAPLPPQHGFPLRLVVPGWYGMTNVKWLARIDVADHAFDGYQQATGYRLRASEEDEGTPVTRMAPRSLLVPPGEPDFHTRVRHLRPGHVRLEGRAWSGWAPVARVEVSTDGGRSWAQAKLEDDLGSRWAWRRFTSGWDAEPGEHELVCRAADEAGNVQPAEAAWNVGGYANNAVHRVRAIVAP